MTMDPFGTRLTAALHRTGTPLCMGIDPHAAMIPPLFGDAGTAGSPDAIRAIGDFVMECLNAAKGRVPAIKPQVAFFEAQGPQGVQILADLQRAAVDAGLLVIIDAKRGDIGSTSTAYAEAWIGHDAPFPSDALTVNPYLGIDTLDPFLQRADAQSAGLFVLVRTSNPGAGDLQDLDVDGAPVFTRLADRLAPLAASRTAECGWSSLGIVAGATWPEEAVKLRDQLPTSPFLVPGFGAQGGSATAALASLKKINGIWEGGLINSTRGLIFPQSAAGATSMVAWRNCIDSAIEDSRATLAAID